MLTRGRVYVVAAVVLGLACGLLVLVWHGIGAGPEPEPGPHSGNEAPSHEVPAGGAPIAPAQAPTATGPAAPVPPPVTRPVTGPSGPKPAAPHHRAKPPATPGPAPVALDGPTTDSLLGRLVDRVGVALPYVGVSVRTVGGSRAVLTVRSERTDLLGQFRFRAPAKSGLLHLWSPRFGISVRRAWRPEAQTGPVEFRLEHKALVGRLIGRDGGPPRWPGFHLRLALVPTDTGSVGASAPVAYVPQTGAFTALMSGDHDVDLEVVALGDTGRRQLARVPRVNDTPLPLVVTLDSPEAYFGAMTMTLAGVPHLEGEPGMETDRGAGRQHLPLTSVGGDRYRVGPLAPRSYLVRVALGDLVTAWRRAVIASGRTLDLGALVLQSQGRLRVRPVGSDGVALRGVRVSLWISPSVAVPARFEEDGRGLVATRVSPGRYEVRAHPPRAGSGAARPPATASTTVEVRPGGVHEVVIRLP